MGIDPYFLDNRIPQVAAALGDKDQPTDDRYRWMVETVREVLFEADPQGNWTYLNPAWTRILGYQVGDCLGKPFLDFVHPEDRESNLKIFLDVVQGGKDRCRFEARYLTQSGTIRHMEIHAWIFRSEKGEPLGSTGTLTDVTERRLAEIALEHRATHDTLTGLPNRDSLGRQLLSALRIDHAFKPIALMFLDLDRFKLINDSLGHDAGDELLRVVAERVRHTVRAGDFIGRFGGDEFVIICSGLDTEQARAMAQSLRLALAKPMHIEGQELTLTVSIGIRILHPDEELPCPPEVFAKILLRDADSAMYAAKTSGRDRAEIFDLPMRERIVRRLGTENALRKALEAKQFFLDFQPQVSLATGHLIGIEALLRWSDPERGVISPAEFIGIAEDSGLIMPIGRWVLDEVCRLIVLGDKNGNPLPRTSINVSPHQLAMGFLPEIAQVLKESGASPERLCIEVTESALLLDTDHAITNLTALAELGVAVSLDDFGTGFSSLSYLQRLPLAELKIDRSFVNRIGNRDGRAIAGAVIAMAGALDLHTVAEGVELPVQARLLQELGCSGAQGYLFARSMPLDQALATDSYGVSWS